MTRGRRVATARWCALVLAGMALTTDDATAQLPPIFPTPTPTPAPTASATPQPPPAAAPAAPTASWVTDGGDLARTSASGDDKLTPPFGVLWTRSVRGGQFALIDGGRAVIGGGPRLQAVETATGKTLWTAAVPGGVTGLAADGGRVFSIASTSITAFDAASGQQVWTTSFGRGFGNGIIAAGGAVYAQEQGITAFSAADGAQLWHTGTDGTDGQPAIAGDRLYYFGGCTLGALDRRSGRRLWSVNPGCTGGGGGRVIAWRDQVFSPDSQAGAYYGLGRRSATDGTAVPGPVPDAVAGDVGLKGRRAIDMASGRTLWSHKDVNLRAVIGATAFGIRSSGALAAFDLRSGALLWSASLAGTDSFSGGARMLAAGGGIVLVRYADGKLAALAPLGRARPEPMSLRVLRGVDVVQGSFRTIRVRRGRRLLASGVVLQGDRFPYGRGGYDKLKGVPDLPSAADLSIRAVRNTRLRLRDASGRRSRTVTLFVYPRFRERVRQSGGRVRVTVRVSGDRGVRWGGRTLALYRQPGGTRRLIRLGAGRLVGTRRAAARFSFSPLSRVGRRDRFYYCVRGAHKLGYGRADLLSRGCGRAILRY